MTQTRPRPYGLERQVTLSEMLDRVLNKGAVLTGEVVISVAGIDLLYVGLNLLVSSVETLRNGRQVSEETDEARHM
ncbi:gas vesicle protein [Acidobacteria bacterium AH-259-G07]|nr:gas vesicle protein [Acidobacteria bacterium AH-259-G07]